MWTPLTPRAVLVVVPLLALTIRASAWAQTPPQLPGGEDACGKYCLYVALRSLDVPVNRLAELDDKLGPVPVGGFNLRQLQLGAQAFGLQALGVETNLVNLNERAGRYACIAHFKEGHFALLTDIRDDLRGVTLIDPPSDPGFMPSETLHVKWSGHALLISPDPLQSEEDVLRTVFLRVLLKRTALTALILIGAVTVYFFWRRRRSSTAQLAALACLTILYPCGCESAQNAESSATKIQVKWVRGNRPGAMRGAISIVADVEGSGEQRVRIPVSGTILEPGK